MPTDSQPAEPASHWTRGALLSRPTQYLVDAVVLGSAFVLAYLLRFEFALQPDASVRLLHQLPLVLLIQWLALQFFGGYDFVWRYFGMSELMTFVRAGLVANGALLALRLGLPASMQGWRVPLSIIVMDGVLAWTGVMGVRVLRRAIAEERLSRSRHARQVGDPARVLLIGAGSAGLLAMREIRSRGALDLDVRGFVDDDPTKRGASVAGVRVLGNMADLKALVEKHQIDHVIITIADVSRERLQRILDACAAVPVRAQTIPSLYDILQGRLEITRFKDVRVEDLLSRDQVKLDEGDLVQFLAGRCVMVTGAGGSIGSELVRQVARFRPSRLLLVERSEPALFQIQQELKWNWAGLDLVPLVADVGDAARMRRIFQRYRPEVVTHAAAHKHVPLMELNCCEALSNNVIGTWTLGELAGESGVDVFVMISTDKAVRPSSMMGASKRIAELVVQDLDRRYATKYVAVRFGNVLGSAGSVIPTFWEQIKRGGPVTVTDPEMRRYFMTIPEASVLVLEAGAMGEGSEIFVLDMGEPVRIVDLANRMIELAGFVPGKDVQIKFTGSRPGEKLFEELETSDEAITKTRHPKIFIGKIAGRCPDEIGAFLSELTAECQNGAGPRRLRRMVADFLPEADISLGDDGEAQPEVGGVVAAARGGGSDGRPDGRRPASPRSRMRFDAGWSI